MVFVEIRARSRGAGIVPVISWLSDYDYAGKHAIEMDLS